MFVHIQYKLDVRTRRPGGPTSRVTVNTTSTPPSVKSLFGEQGPVLILGTLPNISVIPLFDIEAFWIEEN